MADAIKIVVAPNAFKNSITAEEAAFAISKGFQKSNLPCNCIPFPVGDGGDGTGKLLSKKLHGVVKHLSVLNAMRLPVPAAYGYVDKSKTAIIEMAEASGLRSVDQKHLNPLEATSYGTGQLIANALDRGATTILVCVGGSATTDGGTGILQALGIRFLDGSGKDLAVLPRDLPQLKAIDITGRHTRIDGCQIIVLCDVRNQLLGERGTARIFAPQKGAGTQEIMALDKGLDQLAANVKKEFAREISNIEYAGAAGGTAAGLYGVLNARLVNGIDYFLDLAAFDVILKGANLVVTGEGSIDTQTLEGKAPAGVAKRAREKGIPVIAFGGEVTTDNADVFEKFFNRMLPINPPGTDLDAAMRDTKRNLSLAAEKLGNNMADNGITF